MRPVRWLVGLARDGTFGRSDDLWLIRLYALLRLLVGVAICIGAFFIEAREADTRLWLLLVATVWLPLSALILVATLRTRSRLVLLIGPLADLIFLATAQGLLHQGIALTACYPIIAAFAAYTCPGVSTWALGGFTLALMLVVQSQLPSNERFTVAGFGLFAALVVGVLLIVERATSRSRGAEERFVRAKTRADVVLAAVGTAVVVTDARSRVLTANPAADVVLGDREPLAGKSCSAAIGLHLGERRLDCRAGCELLALSRAERGLPERAGQDLPPRASADAGRPPSAGSETSDFEAWRPGHNGDRQPLLVSVNAIPAADGPGVEVVHSLRDITRLKQADEAKTLFLATASHELRTPLTVINGFAKTLTTRSLPPEKQREALAAIRRRGEELSRVVDRLLLSSRIEAGRAEVAHGPVDLIPLVYERAAALADATDRHIEVDLPDDLPSASGDPSAIVTVIDHLLDNAVKYSPGGDPVYVRGQVGPAEDAGSGGVAGSFIALAIVDAGLGMDAATVEHCFDKFWQADASGTRRFGGTGIGLYIVRSLVEAMGGTVSVRSEPGAGSAFTVRLPTAADTEPPAVPGPSRGEQQAVTPRRVPRLVRLSRPDSEARPTARD